jgi:hypothetical protein
MEDPKFLTEQLHRILQRRVSPGATIRVDICIVDEQISRNQAKELCRETVWGADVNSSLRLTCIRDQETSLQILHGI